MDRTQELENEVDEMEMSEEPVYVKVRRDVKALRARNAELEAEVERLRKALEKISEPIKYFMQKAKDGNLELDPHYVLQLADNAGWLRDIAKAALEASDGIENKEK